MYSTRICWSIVELLKGKRWRKSWEGEGKGFGTVRMSRANLLLCRNRSHFIIQSSCDGRNSEHVALNWDEPGMQLSTGWIKMRHKADSLFDRSHKNHYGNSSPKRLLTKAVRPLLTGTIKLKLPDPRVTKSFRRLENFMRESSVIYEQTLDNILQPRQLKVP